jgi:hypothetical protein
LRAITPSNFAKPFVSVTERKLLFMPHFAMYARAFDLPARPFMRPSLEEKAPELTAALQATVNEAIKES